MAKFRDLLRQHNLYETNHAVMLQFFDKSIAANTPARRGAATLQEKARQQEFKALKAKYSDHVNALNELEGLLNRRQSPEHVNNGFTRIETRYKQHYDLRTRRYLEGPGAQRLSRECLLAVADHTLDFDISNCVFSLLPQLLDRLGVRCPLEEAQCPIVRRISQDRNRVISELECRPAEGKEVLIKALNGEGGVSQESAILKSLRTEGRVLRWLAVSVLPDLHDAIIAAKTKDWPEATAFHHLWTIAEDICLEAWMKFCLRLNPSHLSLHFDGIRIDAGSVPDKQVFITDSMAWIKTTTGFDVTIAEKKGEDFLDVIRRRGEQHRTVASPIDVPWYPNCIPVALAHLRPQAALSLRQQCVEKTAQNVAAALRKGRRYADWNTRHGFRLVPYHGVQLEKAPLLLLHVVLRTGPHCVALRQEGGEWVMLDGRDRWTVSEDMIFEGVTKAIATDSVTTFAVIDDAAAAAGQQGPEHTLLELVAGMFRPMQDSDDASEFHVDVAGAHENSHDRLREITPTSRCSGQLSSRSLLGSESQQDISLEATTSQSRSTVGMRRASMRRRTHAAVDMCRETVQQSVFGVAGHSEAEGLNARGLCLVLALKVLAYDVLVPPGLRGPLHALQDGNRLLAPLQARLYRHALNGCVNFLQVGAYVLGILGHFLPLRVTHAQWVVFPEESALFVIISGDRALSFDAILHSVSFLEESTSGLRHDMGELAGRIVFNNLLGFTDLALLLSHDLGRLLEIERWQKRWTEMLRFHLCDYIGGAASDPREMSLLDKAHEKEKSSCRPNHAAVELARVAVLEYSRTRPTRRADAERLNARHLCLVLALQILGYAVTVPDGFRGPLRALLDGNRLLAPFHARLFRHALREQVVFLDVGQYILGHLGHFLPFRVDEAQWVTFPHGCALFYIVNGTRALLFDTILASMSLFARPSPELRSQMGELAGRITFNNLMGFTDLAMLLSLELGYLLEKERLCKLAAELVSCHTRDYLGGATEEAGASLGLDDEVRDDDRLEMHWHADPLDMANFNPALDLLDSMRQEVRDWTARLSCAHGGARPMKGPRASVANIAIPDSVSLSTADGKYRCPLCPQRIFTKIARVVAHITKYHTPKRKYTAAGGKQLRVIKASHM